MSLNAFGFINNTCKCEDFGFLPEPEWSDELNQPYCRCDTSKGLLSHVTREKFLVYRLNIA